MCIPFHPLTLADRPLVTPYVQESEHRNCDLNFTNLYSWRFLYQTEIADYKDWTFIRFQLNGQTTYLTPVSHSPQHVPNYAEAFALLFDDANRAQHPFRMMGVCPCFLQTINDQMPNQFVCHTDRKYADYIYRRTHLATLAGKKWQAKRNFVNRFLREHPSYELSPLQKTDTDECLLLYEQWMQAKLGEQPHQNTYAAERQSMQQVFGAWQALQCQGLVLRVDGRIAAFTYGSPINHDTFDVCVEKADASLTGVYAFINQAFAQSIPEQYELINREEDLGIAGLRTAKLSYHPDILLEKSAITSQHLSL